MGHLLGQLGNLFDLLVDVLSIRLINVEHSIADIFPYFANFYAISPHLLSTNPEAVQLHVFVSLEEVFGHEYWLPCWLVFLLHHIGVSCSNQEICGDGKYLGLRLY